MAKTVLFCRLMICNFTTGFIYYSYMWSVQEKMLKIFFTNLSHQIYVILVVGIINDLEHNKMSLIYIKKSFSVCLFVSFMKFRSTFEYRLVYWEHQCSEQNWSLNWICADEQLSESAAMAHVQPLKKSIRRWSWVYK